MYPSHSFSSQSTAVAKALQRLLQETSPLVILLR